MVYYNLLFKSIACLYFDCALCSPHFNRGIEGKYGQASMLVLLGQGSRQ